jgi:S-adenosylmethionine decarboxylase
VHRALLQQAVCVGSALTAHDIRSPSAAQETKRGALLFLPAAVQWESRPIQGGFVMMDGIHLLGEWYGCLPSMPEMQRADALRKLCVSAVESAGLTIVGDRFHQFDPQGVTGAVILAESHLAIHTWPEIGSVTIDVYVCNYSTDNSRKAEALFQSLQGVFQPEHSRFQAIHRGGRDG